MHLAVKPVGMAFCLLASLRLFLKKFLKFQLHAVVHALCILKYRGMQHFPFRAASITTEAASLRDCSSCRKAVPLLPHGGFEHPIPHDSLLSG